jgi:uncharacterized repeat protein (TIGR02543 family)
VTATFTVGASALSLPTPILLGYTFTGWNLSVNGTGTSYAVNTLFTPSSNVTLYAQWISDIYLLTFNTEGGTLASPSVSFTVGASALLLPTPVLMGSTFTGWSASPIGSGTSYGAASAYTPVSNVTLYAQWTVDPGLATVTVTFVGNGATGSIAPWTVSTGASVVLPLGDSFSFTGNTFVAWSTAATSGGATYQGASSLIVNSSITLYALWTPSSSVTISFAANGGVGAVSAVSGMSGGAVTIPGGTGISYVGHTFASWNTAANGSGTTYNVDASLALNGSITLYAQWDALLSAKSPSVLVGAVGSFANNSFTLTANLKAQVHRLAELTRAEHYGAETLYGYTSDTGSARTQMVISDLRASAVATYLRQQLALLHVTGVKVTSVGEGAVKAETAAMYRRVEVFVES